MSDNKFNTSIDLSLDFTNADSIPIKIQNDDVSEIIKNHISHVYGCKSIDIEYFMDKHPDGTIDFTGVIVNVGKSAEEES